MELLQFNSEILALRALSTHLMKLVEQKGNRPFHIALSGGGTAQKMFSLWMQEYKTKINFHCFRFYWVDERCVPPTDPESNYGQAKRLFFDPMQIPDSHIYRIQGEKPPQEEVVRYIELIRQHIPKTPSGLPVFDCIFLGVGNDLHTASIFPSTPELITDSNWYSVSTHPQTGQLRITMTGSVLLAGTPLLVPVIGKEKKSVIVALQDTKNTDQSFFPAFVILHRANSAVVYVGE